MNDRRPPSRGIMWPMGGTSGSGSGGTMRADVWDDIDVGRLDAVCRQYGVSALFVLGSVARGRPVDLVARVALHPMLQAAVLGEAQPLYAA